MESLNAKIETQQIENIFSELKKSSRVSLVLVIAGAVMFFGSFWYSVTRLRPLQLEIGYQEAKLQKISTELEDKEIKFVELESRNKSLAAAMAAAEQQKIELEKSVSSLKSDQTQLLDFIVQIADNKKISILDKSVSWNHVKDELLKLPAGDRKKALLISMLLAWKDIPFTLGGGSASAGFDSPRFMNFVLSEAGAGVTPKSGQRMSDALMEKYIKTDAPQPGDLVFYKGQIGSFGLIYLSHGKDGANPVGIGTLQAHSPLQIISLSNINTRDFPMIGYYKVIYPDEKKT